MITDKDWEDALSGDLVRVEKAIKTFESEGKISQLNAYQDLDLDYQEYSLLETLMDLGGNSFGGFRSTQFPLEILRFRHFLSLDLFLSEAETIPDFAPFFPHLKHIAIKAPFLKDLSVSWEKLPDLLSLSISFTKLQSLRGGFEECPNLESLAVIFSDLRDFPRGISHVKRLNFLGNGSLSRFPNEPQAFRKCELLILNGTGIAQLPNNPDLFPALRELDLSKTFVKALPVSVADWGIGLTIDLSDSHLSTLPDSLLSSNSIESLQLQGTPLAKLLNGQIPEDDISRTARTKEKLRYFQLSKRFKVKL